MGEMVAIDKNAILSLYRKKHFLLIRNHKTIYAKFGLKKREWHKTAKWPPNLEWIDFMIRIKFYKMYIL